jgi:hypothetical protein
MSRAAEVDARMAEWARRRGLEVEVAAFEAWDPAGRVFDAVVSGGWWLGHSEAWASSIHPRDRLLAVRCY